MKNEALFIAILIAPWAFVIAALIFYRQRRKRKAPDNPGE
jgi:hypothetical protein